MLRYIILLTGLVLVLAVATGCDNRGTGIEPLDLGDLAEHTGVDKTFFHPFAHYLTTQPKNQQERLYGAAIWPPSAIEMPPKHPIPMLILLAPEGGDEYYYFNAGLAELYSELIAADLIQPMLIFCLSNDPVFGGYFYGNSAPGGYYDSIFHYVETTLDDSTDNLVDRLHLRYPSTIQDKRKRGIGGVGQGAYGAFRALIKNPDQFTSISVTDGPLDFDGAGNGGLINLFDDVLAEQHEFYASNPKIDRVVDNDTTFLPFDFRRDFDSSYTMPISRMLIGGAFAFSPNDTLLIIDRDVPGDGPNMTVEIVSRHSIADSLLVGGGDSTTFINEMMGATPRTRYFDLDFHMPFDGFLTQNTSIWDLWMRNNLADMYALAPDALDGVSMWFGTNRSSRWGYYDMTQSWISDIQPTHSSMIEVHEYSSAAGDIELGDENLYGILKDMLIFHSNNFGE